MTGKIVKIGVALVVAAAAFSAVAVQAVDSPETLQKRKFQRLVQQRQNLERKRQEVNLNWVKTRHIDGNPAMANDFNSSTVRDSYVAPRGNSLSGAKDVQVSPGLHFANTSYEYQHNYTQGYQVGRQSGRDYVHLVWMHWNRLPQDIEDNDRYVSYEIYDLLSSSFVAGFNGTPITTPGNATRGGYINMSVTADGRCQASFHQREDATLPYEPNHTFFELEGFSIPTTEALTGYGAAGCNEVLWPRNAASRDGAPTYNGVRHEIAHSNSNPDPGCDPLLWYWRHNGTAWTGPVVIDSGDAISYAIADNPVGDQVCVAVHASNWVSMNGVNNVCYYQSNTDGAGWISGAEPKTKNLLTNYTTVGGLGAWLHLSVAYDNAGTLHIVWDEQREENLVSDCALRHWNNVRNTIRPITLAYYETPFLTGVFNINLAKVTMGIGDGSTTCAGSPNTNYVYVTYTKFGGSTPAEAEDVSVGGYYNGELYLSVSNSGGNTWAPPVNLSNTKTPNCNPGPADTATGIPLRPDSICASEHWSTIGQVVEDIDIILFADRDAGGIPQGEGTWQLNPIHYLRIPGGTADAQHVCPVIAANYEATLTFESECEYHATPTGQNTETFTLINLGNATMSGTITVTDFPGAPTLTLSGGAGAYSIPAGSPDIVKTVTMASNGAAEGLYVGQIAVTHNDGSKPSPQTYPINFFVFNQFFCPQDEVIKTGVASPGSLALEVESNGRFASQNAEGGLWRHSDSSSTIFDASLLIAHGTQGADTTVFLRFFGRETNGQFGFRSQGDLVIDTSAYGTGAGCATASAKMSTRDSIVGITVNWYFPQTPADDELVFAEYKIYRHKPATAVSNLAVGILMDADVVPASRLGNIQSGVNNEPFSDGTRNLVYIGGTDTAGHVISGTNTATRFRGGVAVPTGFDGAVVGNNVQDIQPGGGPTDGFLYNALQTLAGIDLYSVADTDLYILIAMDKGASINSGETLTYKLVYASDTVNQASFIAKVDAGITRAGQANFGCGGGCSCPCPNDPAPNPTCDGITDVLDVVGTVNVAFRGFAAIQDPGCPKQRTDVNCDDATDVLDVVRVVNVAFRGFTPASQFCDPCS